MKHTIKQTSLLLLATLGIFVSLATASASALAYPTPVVATIVCPAGQTAIASHGQTDPKSCCPNSVANTPEQDRPRSCLFAKYLNPIVNLLSAVVGLAAVSYTHLT